MRDVHAALRLALVAALGACGGQTDGGKSCDPKPSSPVPTTSMCGASYTMSIGGAAPCGIDSTQGPTPQQCSSICATGTTSCLLTNDTTITCMPFCGKARTSLRVRRGPPTIATHLRDSVVLEAASVCAFERLARELAAHGAPLRLRRAALVAARDESRHARAVARMARRHGVRGRARAPRAAMNVRALVDVAIENAIEGCVHETYGAALARFQSERAPDPRDRTALREIARDEARHAALAEKIDAWVKPKLSRRDRERVDAARQNAANALVCAVRATPSLPMLGMPNATEATALAEGLGSLWRDP
jgi:hypothetical protein